MPNRGVCDIDEIIRVICRCCDKPTLANLARTNHCFSDPALDVLWESLDSFSHLLRLLPSDLVTWQSFGYGPAKPAINHLIVPRDWHRFSLYAPRVRSWGQEDLSYVEEHIVDHIAFGRNPGYILPRLQHMAVSATTVSGVHLQTLILCPTLRSVTIWNSAPSQHATRAMQTFLRTLADRAPGLERLVVHWDKDGAAAFRDGLADLYAPTALLRSIHLWSPGCVTPGAFALLAGLPRLDTLHVNLVGAPDADALIAEVARPERAFGALQHVFLAGALEECRKVLRCFGVRRMASVGFSVRQYPRAKALRELFETVASYFAGSLGVLQFNVAKDELDGVALNRYMAEPEAFVLDMAVLRPLFDIRGLVAVHLELGLPLQLSDMDLTLVGSAWPKMEVLKLCSDPFCERARGMRPMATVEGLFALLAQCTALHDVGLYVDYSCAIDTALIASTPVTSGCVKRLDVGRSWITNAAQVAGLLSGVLPELEQLEWAGMGDVEGSWPTSVHGASWKQVYELLPIFRAVRADERGKQGLEMYVD